MQIEKTLTGFIVISDIINNQLVVKKYQGYTKQQAIKLFKASNK